MGSGVSSPPPPVAQEADDAPARDRIRVVGGPPRGPGAGLSVTHTQQTTRLVALFLFWATAVYLTILILGSGGVPSGTTVNGIAIGGMDRESAINTLNAAVAARRDQPLKLKALGNTTTVKPSDLGLGADVEATVDEVSTDRMNPFDLYRALFGDGDNPLVLTVDQTKLSNQVEVIGSRLDRPVSEPEITYDGLTPKLTDGEMGTLVNREAAAAAIASGYLKSDRSIELPVGSSSPAVSAEQARAVLGSAANAAVSGPVVAKAGDTTVQATADDIASTLSFQVRDGQLAPVIDGAKLHTRLADQLAPVDKAAVDASWDVSSGTPVLTPSQAGNGVTDDNIAASVVSALGQTGDARVATLSLGPLEPKLTTEAASALGITESMATFTQNFPYAAYRVQNIGQAAKKIDNTLIPPGGTFSMNDVVGERTKANGFTKGYVVGEGGRLQEDLGGGVSTAATALWTAAFYAGLERVEQGSHLIWISRYRPGLEATVAWGQLDLKFRNDTPNGVLITTKMTNESISVTIWGKKQFEKIKAVAGPKENVTPFPTEKNTGTDCVKTVGVKGFDISMSRVFINGGKEVKRQTFPTHYIPEPRVECESASKPLS